MTIANEITRISNAKAAIKQSIQNKGVSVSDTAKLDEYPALIDSITVGSGGESGESYKNPDFYEMLTKGETSFRGLFSYCNVDIDLSKYDTSKATDMSYMFAYFAQSDKKITVSNFKSLDFSSTKSTTFMFNYYTSETPIDLSGKSFPVLTNAKSMFYNVPHTTAIDLSNVDMPNVTDAADMFNVGYSNQLTSLNLTGINMPSITNANNMFQYCNKLTSIDVSSIDFSKVTSMNTMFGSCTKLVDVIGEIDCSSLAGGLYPSSYSDILYNCTAVETVYLKNIYKNVTTMKNESKWSINFGKLKVKDECLIYIINELPDLINDKGLTATDKIILTLPKTNTLTAEQVQPAIDKGWTVANTTY